MAGTINTSAVLNNGWNSGNSDQILSGPIAIDPSMEKSYDFALTLDPIALQEKNRNQEILFELFQESPFFEKYGGLTDSSIPFAKKIERADVIKVFYYFKEKIEERIKISIMELVILICEFFELDYKYVNDNVLSPPLQAKLVREIYDLGYKKEKIENTEKLF